ncbi:MAG: hypothetical protein ABIN94_11845 [Ferruginibacter sp.]
MSLFVSMFALLISLTMIAKDWRFSVVPAFSQYQPADDQKQDGKSEDSPLFVSPPLYKTYVSGCGNGGHLVFCMDKIARLEIQRRHYIKEHSHITGIRP